MSLKKLCSVVFFASALSFVSVANEQDDLYEKALAELEVGNKETALIHVKNLLKENQDNLPARLLFAQILLDYGELAAAEDQYERALALNVDKSLIMLPLAKVLMLQSKYNELLEKITLGNYGAKVNSGIYTYRGSAYTQKNQLDKAKQNLEQALVLDNRNIDAMLGLATLATTNKNQAAYDKYLAMAKATAPDSASVWFYQAESLRRLNLPDQALTAYNKVIELTPEHVEARRSRAIIYLEKNELAAANADLTYIMDVSPLDPFTRLLQAFYYNKTAESKKSQDILLETSYQFSQLDSEKFDQFAPLLFIDGLTHFLLGNLNEAKKSLRKFLIESPNSDEAKELLSEIAVQQGDFDETINILSGIAPQYLSKRSATLLLSAHLSKQQPTALIETYNSLSITFQETPHIKKLYALGLIVAGEQQKALSILESQAEGTGKIGTQLMLGYHYLQFQLYDQALLLAQKLEEQAELPNSALNFIAISYENTGQIAEAKEFYQKALTQTPYDPVVTENFVQYLIRHQQLEEAEKVAANFIQRNSANKAMLKLHAQILDKQLKINDALTNLLAVEILDNKDLEVKYQLVNLYLKLRQPQEVLNKTKDIRRLEPLSSAVLIAEAKAHLMTDNLAEASKSLNIAFGLNFDDVEKLSRIALLQIDAQDWQYADRTAQEIKRLNPQHESLPIIQARILYGQNKTDEAIVLLTSLKNKSPQVLEDLARYYRNEKQTDNAIKYARATYQMQASYNAMQLLLELYWLNNQAEEAFNLLEKWLQANADDLYTRRVYANLLSQKQRRELAKEQYEFVLMSEPNDIFSLNNLAMLMLHEQAYDKALEYAQKAIEQAPQDAVINDTLGWILVQQNKAEQALPYFRTSLARDSNNKTTRYHLAVALANSNRIDASISELQKLTSEETNFPEKQLAKEKLQALLSR